MVDEVVCGCLGMGSTRAQDQEALRRIHDHLAPGGRLVLDDEVPYSDARSWGCWVAQGGSAVPERDSSMREASSELPLSLRLP
jgi:hypothetical protein